MKIQTCVFLGAYLLICACRCSQTAFYHWHWKGYIWPLEVWPWKLEKAIS